MDRRDSTKSIGAEMKILQTILTPFMMIAAGIIIAFAWIAWFINLINRKIFK